MKKFLCILLLFSTALVYAAPTEDGNNCDSLEYYYFKALNEYEQGYYDEARKSLHEVIRECVRNNTSPELDFEARLLLSQIARGKGRLDQSEKWIKSITGRASHHPEVCYPEGWKTRVRQEMADTKALIKAENRRKAVHQRGIVYALIGTFTLLLIILYLYIGKARAYRRLAAYAQTWASTNTVANRKSVDRDLAEQICDYFETSNCFLDPEFKISDLATALGSNRTYISKAVNSMAANYNTFVNTYRVKEAIRMLSDNKRMSIEDVCVACGFNNRKSFNSAFKQFTGLTPSEYRSSI